MLIVCGCLEESLSSCFHYPVQLVKQLALTGLTQFLEGLRTQKITLYKLYRDSHKLSLESLERLRVYAIEASISIAIFHNSGSFLSQASATISFATGWSKPHTASTCTASGPKTAGMELAKASTSLSLQYHIATHSLLMGVYL
eukprot:TRINITY_DN8480_c0_g1_i3.p1 TRINITY_DN8480_c0_g1~~TRINITY_DN8480_c0_g1_i3.p1  ORF type:complete len:143 (+),score=14.50 TRINITY_DN8480_c0_g1_i3:424-852(+)